SENEAERLNIPYKSVKIKATDIAGYYPNAQPIHIKLVYQKDNRRLLGGQIIGEKGVDKRVDVLATDIFNKIEGDDIKDLERSHAPPYYGACDPIQRTARRA